MLELEKNNLEVRLKVLSEERDCAFKDAEEEQENQRKESKVLNEMYEKRC